VTIGQSGAPLRIPEDEERASQLTVAKVLRLLGAGAGGTILIVLGDGPLRTKQLTERIPGYAPRTIYRYAGKLAQLGIVERHEEPGVPSKVVHQLTEPCGRELHELVDAYAEAAMARLPAGEISAHEWGSFALLADLWDSGMVEELNLDPRSATELARGPHGLSFHQVSRRAGLFAKGGFIEEVGEGGRHRRYKLTEKARRGMALVAGLGRWRRRHVLPEGGSGLTAAEVAGLMRTVLPLVVVPEHGEKSLELRILPVGENGARAEAVWADVAPDGAVLSSPEPRTSPAATAEGQATSWVDSVLDGPHNGLRIEGDAHLVKGCLSSLHSALWVNGKPGS
jgi:DNA-binding HxlR family transcriptional regulator